mmetsp:Transcript_60081/g.110404  ORF Transcript_60081/g.110404 Transcript_60081/m.110404 type:complete len:89 (+) Transcript_60081:19-285(+)
MKSFTRIFRLISEERSSECYDCCRRPQRLRGGERDREDPLDGDLRLLFLDCIKSSLAVTWRLPPSLMSSPFGLPPYFSPPPLPPPPRS